MNFGLDLLGLARYSDATIRAFPRGFGIGVFSKVDGFGDALPNLEKILKTGKAPFCRIQLRWSDTHTFKPEDFPGIVKEAKRCFYLKSKYPNVKFYFSGACEHRMSASNAMKLAQMVKAATPGVVYVNCPLSDGAIVPGAINEQHGAGSPRSPEYSFSYDGHNCVDADVEKHKRDFKNATFFMFWNCQANGRWSSDPKKDPTKRPLRKHYPVPEQILGWAYMANSKGVPNFPSKYIYKSYSDQHKSTDGKPKGKDQKPVFVKLPKYKKVEIKRNGRLIATAPYFGTYEGGGFRYYCSEWAWKIAEKAGGICDVFGDGTKIGTIEPGFRQNDYR